MPSPVKSRGAVETDVASYKVEVFSNKEKVLESSSRDLLPAL